MRIIKLMQKEVAGTINDYLKSIKDPIKQLQQYLHWRCRGYYLLELLIDWEMQGNKKYPYDVILPISLRLAKQKWKETSEFINKYRNSPQYEEDMKRLEKEGF